MDACDLTGDWIGFYSGHFEQVIRVEMRGGQWVAVKVTGDDFVPADEETWRVNTKTLFGEGTIAEKEFRNPRRVPGRLEILNRDRIKFSWMNCGEVEFRRDI